MIENSALLLQTACQGEGSKKQQENPELLRFTGCVFLKKEKETLFFAKLGRKERKKEVSPPFWYQD